MHSWIQTYTGRQFFPLNPNVEDVRIEDIAHALSMICRFAGHCREFYSVAEHSVRASYVVPAYAAMDALMHDSTEAYLCDLPGPLKRAIPDYKKYENRMDAVIAERFGINPVMPDCVKWADQIMLATEKRDLMGPSPVAWGALPADVKPLTPQIIPWSAKIAEDRFLQRYGQLLVTK